MLSRKEIQENKFCVYNHIRPDTNEVFYIGIGNLKRAKEKTRRNKLWYSIVKKNNNIFNSEILFDNLTWNEACKKEIELIKLYGRFNLNTGTLANLTDGGDGTGGYKQSQETIEKRVSKFRGRKHTEASKLQMSLSLKGKKRTPEMNEANRLRTLSRKPAPVTIETIELRRKNTAAKLSYYIEVYKDEIYQGIGISGADVARKFNIHNSLTQFFNGTLKNIKGYTFKKINKNEPTTTIV